MSPYDERDTAEIRMMRAITELNHRILMTPSPELRTVLRSAACNLRSELILLIQAIPICDEEDAMRVQTAHGGPLTPMMIGSA